LLNDPTLIIGNYLGGGVYAPSSASTKNPNYNLVMTNNHPEWVVKYAKYVVPSLPKSIGHSFISSYLMKHKSLLQGLMTPSLQLYISG
jgi:hypothetical protein